MWWGNVTELNRQQLQYHGAMSCRQWAAAVLYCTMIMQCVWTIPESSIGHTVNIINGFLDCNSIIRACQPEHQKEGGASRTGGTQGWQGLDKRPGARAVQSLASAPLPTA
jgi:hypothetical protein